MKRVTTKRAALAAHFVVTYGFSLSSKGFSVKATTTTRAHKPAQPARTARVFTYARVSKKRQAKEDKSSFERQERYARAYAEKHGLILDEELRFEDRGVSGFHGDNVKDGGALKRFLDAFDARDVLPGDVLIVESFDRLSRQEPIDANEHFERLVRGGVVIVMSGKDGGDGREFSRAALKRDDTLLILARLEQSRAYRESERKQQLARDGIGGKCRQWLEGRRGFRVVSSRNDPAWVQWDEGKNAFAFNDKVKAIRRAIELYRAGHGRPEVCRTLEAEGMPLAKSYPANVLYGNLRNAALKGVREVKVAGEVFRLPGYYPAVVTDDEFDELQAMLAGRSVSRGRADAVAVVTGIGISYCAACGSILVGQHTSRLLKNGKAIRRVRCGHKYKKGGRCEVNVDSCLAETLEMIVLNFCGEQANLDALFSVASRDDERAVLLEEQRANLTRLEYKINAYAKRMDDEDDPMTATERKKLRQFEAEQEAAEKEIEQLERELKMNVTRRVSTAKQWRELVSGVVDLDPDTRLKARSLVHDTFERIEVWMSAPKSQDQRMMTVRLKGRNGVERIVMAERKTGDIISIQDTDHIKHTTTSKVVGPRQRSL